MQLSDSSLLPSLQFGEIQDLDLGLHGVKFNSNLVRLKLSNFMWLVRERDGSKTLVRIFQVIRECLQVTVIFG